MLARNQENENEKLQIYIDHYHQKFWHDLDGNDLEKFLAMLCDYSSYGNPISREWWNTHASAVKEVLDRFIGESYLEKYPGELKCTVGYLILQLCKKLYRKQIDRTGKIAAIFSLAKKYQGIDAWEIIYYLKYNPKEDLPRSFLFRDDLYPDHASNFILALFKENQWYSTIPFAIDTGIVNSKDLISHLINNNILINPYHFLTQCNISLPPEDTISLYTQSLENKKYLVALYLFCKTNSLEHVTGTVFTLSSPSYDVANFHNMLLDLITIMQKDLPNDIRISFISELIDHMENNKLSLCDKVNNISHSSHDTDYCTYFYVNLCNIKERIRDWDANEKKYLESFKPDYEKALFLAIQKCYTTAAGHLVQYRKVSILEQKWYRNNCENHYEFTNKEAVTISPFFAALHNLEKAYKDRVKLMPNIQECLARRATGDKVFCNHVQMIKLLIALEPVCIKQCNTRNEDVFWYIDNINVNACAHYKNGNEILNQIVEIYAALQEAKLVNLKNNYLTFFNGTKDAGSSLKTLNCEDVRKVIGSFSFRTM